MTSIDMKSYINNAGFMRAPWLMTDPLTKEEYVIELLTPEEFDTLPEGQLLVSIAHEFKIKGIDFIDNDTRGGMLAYGIKRESND